MVYYYHNMARKYFNLLLLSIGTILIWYLTHSIESIDLVKIQDTAIVLTVLYLFFKIFLEDFVVARINNPKTRYSLNKGLSITYVAVLLLFIGGIWIENVQALLVAYGLVAAGVAISLQDFFKNLAGGIILLIFGIHKVGDRVEIDGKTGDIIDIGIMYTTLLEIQNWISGEQATGRLTIIHNGYILSHTTHNFTKDNMFIWDEITVPITYNSNWEKASQMLLEITNEETAGIQQAAEEEIEKLKHKYYLSDREAEPVVYLTITDNWIELKTRYVTMARDRRITANHISKSILQQIEATSDITIASETIQLVCN